MSNDINNNINNNINNINKDKITQKKRGRPRKNKDIFIVPIRKQEQKKNIGENNHEIILHLPISTNDITNYQENNTSELNTDNNIIGLTEKIAITISDISNDSNNNNDYLKVQINKLMEEISEKDSTIIKLKKELQKKIQNETVHNQDNEVNENYKIVNVIDNKPIIVTKTDISCWWCTYVFDNIPCFIPEKYQNETYFVFGCFCSYNCAVAYNFSQYIHDNREWCRYSLIKQLYNLTNNIILNKDNIDKIEPALPRELLEKFGGYMNINEYRKNTLICKKDYSFILPLVIPIIVNTNNKLFNSINDLIYKVGRKKPIYKNTIINTLELNKNI